MFLYHPTLVFYACFCVFEFFCWFVFLKNIRGRQALEKRTTVDDERIELLEQMVKEATEAANEAEKKYDEVGVRYHMVPQVLHNL